MTLFACETFEILPACYSLFLWGRWQKLNGEPASVMYIGTVECKGGCNNKVNNESGGAIFEHGYDDHNRHQMEEHLYGEPPRGYDALMNNYND